MGNHRRRLRVAVVAALVCVGMAVIGTVMAAEVIVVGLALACMNFAIVVVVGGGDGGGADGGGPTAGPHVSETPTHGSMPPQRKGPRSDGLSHSKCPVSGLHSLQRLTILAPRINP